MKCESGFSGFWRGVVYVVRCSRGWLLLVVWDGESGKGWGNFPDGPVVPHLAITLFVLIVVTMGERLGDVGGADDAVAVGFADLDAFVG